MQTDPTMAERERNVRQLLRHDSEIIDLGRAVLCADCPTIHDAVEGPCPRCTCTQGLLLEPILNRRAS